MNASIYNVSVSISILMIFGGIGMISIPYAFIITGALVLILTIYTLRLLNVPNKN